MKHLLLLLTLAALPLYSFSGGEKPLKDGDIVFIVNPGGQGKAIQLATKSKYTHVGIVFIENGRPMVYHAVEPVSRNTIDEFAAMSGDGTYEVKRLKDPSVLDKSSIEKMREMARSMLGKHYDIGFNWSDKEMYCSEFVWKLYERGTGIRIGEPRAMKTYDLSHPAVKKTMAQRYGKNVPLEEPMISPGVMYESEVLSK